MNKAEGCPEGLELNMVIELSASCIIKWDAARIWIAMPIDEWEKCLKKWGAAVDEKRRETGGDQED